MSTLVSHPHLGATPAPGPTKLFGYDVVARLGEGAGSTIYAVRDPASGRRFALKHVTRKTDRDVRFVEQLLNEHAVGTKVSHPYLRRVIDLKLERSLLLRVTSAGLVMELFEGRPMDQLLPPSTVDLLDAFGKVADALGAMHAQRYVHCDLKPANVLRDERTGDVRLIDLGQACPIGTKKARVQGTPDYISPEQVRRQPVDERTDVYNFGATLYWCLCGQRMPTLFTLQKGENSFLVDTFIKSPRDHNPSVPEPLSGFVMECCRTNAEKRPPNMRVIQQRLGILRHGIKTGMQKSE